MKNLFYILLFSLVFFACKKDNYEPPKSQLTGRVVYNGQAIGVRSTGVQLELWQKGYALFTKIPVYVDQDGSYSSMLFDGDYKLVRLRGNGPWVDNTDSIDVKVNGNTQVDVPVVPHFTLANVSIQKSGDAVTATFTVQQANAASTLERVNLYLGTTTIIDNTRQDASAEKPAAEVVIGQPVTLSVPLPAALAGRDYVFARVGVKSGNSAESLFSAPLKIALK
ncbi:MAG: DUF3823 domain-containing protein [Mucilaginibacter polytrichastri]|nr:DUF3823 domain-containing protein [Mucilaginibacter polytrichastri]